MVDMIVEEACLCQAGSSVGFVVLKFWNSAWWLLFKNERIARQHWAAPMSPY